MDPHFLDLGASWRWAVSFTTRPLYPRGRAPGTHSIGGWVGPRAGVDDVEKRKFLTLRGSNSDLSVIQPVASCCTDYANPAPVQKQGTCRNSPLNQSSLSTSLKRIITSTENCNRFELLQDRFPIPLFRFKKFGNCCLKIGHEGIFLHRGFNIIYHS
jgi:hypothetical protein